MVCSWIGPGEISCGESRPSMDIYVSPDGQLRHIYDDALNLADLGHVRISRASHVEPAPTSGWIADLSPVGGPVLGPFAKRAEALAAEVAWLEVNGVPSPV